MIAMYIILSLMLSAFSFCCGMWIGHQIKNSSPHDEDEG